MILNINGIYSHLWQDHHNGIHSIWNKMKATAQVMTQLNSRKKKQKFIQKRKKAYWISCEYSFYHWSGIRVAYVRPVTRNENETRALLLKIERSSNQDSVFFFFSHPSLLFSLSDPVSKAFSVFFFVQSFVVMVGRYCFSCGEI